MTALEARLAEVLAEHGLAVGFHCICGADLRDAKPIAPTAHDSHLAAVLAAEVAAHDEQAARQAAQDRAAVESPVVLLSPTDVPDDGGWHLCKYYGKGFMKCGNQGHWLLSADEGGRP